MITEEDLKSIRRALHKIPEIGLKEYKTHEYLITFIRHLPTEHLEIRVDETAILVKVKGTIGKHTVAWRTDIDGLPILEQTDVEFSSEHVGHMHACGHDVHMTLALGLLHYLSYHPIEHDVVFFFQPAEENEAGAKRYLEREIFKGWEPDEIYALHVNPSLPIGMISTRVGSFAAGDCEFRICLKGKSGHGASPHLANDMIVASASLIQQVQSIVSRNVNPLEEAVITIGSIHGGEATNVIADEVTLRGSIRTLTPELNLLTQNRLKTLVKGIGISYDCDATIELDQKGYVPVINNNKTTNRLIEAAKNSQFVQFEECLPALIAEDFGYLLAHFPGTIFWMGAECEYPLHHEKMLVNEACLMPTLHFLIEYFTSKLTF